MASAVDITPFTLLDYPDKAACIIWFNQCNLRCPYCYNPDFALGHAESRLACSVEEFLEDHKGFLDAVVFSGGECTLSPQLIELCRMAKRLGYLVKIDTNGSSPDVLEDLLNEKLVDYVALDHKAPEYMNAKLTRNKTLFHCFKQSLSCLLRLHDVFEVRTTCHPDILSEEDILVMASELYDLGYRKDYCLQYYFHAERTLGALQEPSYHYNISALRKAALPLIFRNFPNL